MDYDPFQMNQYILSETDFTEILKYDEVDFAFKYFRMSFTKTESRFRRRGIRIEETSNVLGSTFRSETKQSQFWSFPFPETFEHFLTIYQDILKSYKPCPHHGLHLKGNGANICESIFGGPIEVCAICLQSKPVTHMQANDYCSHSFCIGCLDQMAKHNSEYYLTCPTCRCAWITAEEKEEYELDNEM